MPTVLLDTNATAKRLGIKLPTLAKMRLRGDGPPYLRVGGRVLYDEKDVEAFIAALPRLHSTAEARKVSRRPGAGRPPKRASRRAYGRSSLQPA